MTDGRPEETLGDGSYIQCPWCKETVTDLWEYASECGWEDLHEEVECGYCEKSFVLTGSMSITTTAKPVVKEDQHELDPA